MKQTILILLFALMIGSGAKSQYEFTTSFSVQGNKTIVIDLVTTGVQINNAGSYPYSCQYGYNYDVKFDYSIKAFNSNGNEVGFNNIYTLQGVFECGNHTSFFPLPNHLGAGSGVTTGNIWTNQTNCNTATVEDLLCGNIVFEVEMQGYNGPKFIPLTGLSTLPIELITFDAYKNDRVVELAWKTASELNNDYFTIERSIDGLSWENLQIVRGAGNSSSVIDYSWIDYSPFSGVSYYRLKQTDYDGTTETFNIVSIDKNDVEELQAYPNPVSHSVTVIGLQDSEVLRIMNTVGVEVTGNVIVSNSPSKKTFIDMSQLPKGMYFIVNGDESIRVLKQ
ncbi:T9SS type A sorting domain-containing protein [Brumimicrobium mesophilum]|uniref:T9SS type A sorting domain-containing protein n=1 Tax=Brumimicrobium mesophilum TaxID=392717 RepID=UPI000D13FF45|nr:T9SS type A sorting domain-containing protein [Brumimicrobium mesophilum]